VKKYGGTGIRIGSRIKNSRHKKASIEKIRENLYLQFYTIHASIGQENIIFRFGIKTKVAIGLNIA